MADDVRPDVVVHLCHNSMPDQSHLPRQWHQDGAHVVVQELPCSGKTDAQYLMNAFEGGVRGVCVVTCPKGQCRLAQGNYRASIRVQTIQRLLVEMGIEAERAELVQPSIDDKAEDIQARVREAVTRICALGVSPVEVGA